MRRSLAALLLWCAAGLPQGASFEAAAIRRSQSAQPGWLLRPYPGGRLEGERITLQQLVTIAYDLQNHQVIAPAAWMQSERFDLKATAGHPAGEPEMRLMLQTLLSEKFHLRFHHEPKEMPLYFLVTGKSGPAPAPKMRKSPDGDCGKITTPQTGAASGSVGPGATPCGGETVNAGRIVGHRTNMDELAANLAAMAGRSVLNRTGLSGSYDLTLTWTPDHDRARDDSGPSLFTALEEQLGLKLEAGKGPVDVLVIDGAERLLDN